MKESVRESDVWKIFYHEAPTVERTYWLLCKVKYIGTYKYYKIIAKFDFIKDDGTLVYMER
jgi:hypothetical protein